MRYRGQWLRRSLQVHTYAVLVFLYAPVLLIFIYSFNDSRLNAVWHGFTWRWYGELLGNSLLLEALMNSLLIASISTALSTAIGTATALALHRSRLPLKGTMISLLYLPILIPDIVMGLSLLVLFSQFLIPLGKITILLAHITFSMSYVYVVVAARLAGLNPQLEEAAGDLGAGGWQTFRYVTLPLIAPGVAAGALIAFTLSLDDFMISFFVAGPNSTTLPIYIYGMVKRGVTPELNALSSLLIVFTVGLVFLAEYLRRKPVGS